MSYDVFGDLREWGRVLDQVRRMREDGTSGQHQAGLARLARYPYNWRLRQAALCAMAELKQPCEEVLRAALGILADEGGDLETRVLAGMALCGMLNGCESIGDDAHGEAAASIAELSAKPQPPVLQAYVRKAQALLPVNQVVETTH